MLKSFPSGSGRTIWVRDSGESTMHSVNLFVMGEIKRSQTVRLANSHKDDSGNRWYEFKISKV